ncbi:MAG: CHRD domain-containing protein [Amphiplicatus sp.]
MRMLSLSFLLLAAALLAAPAAQASVFTGALSGANESPPNASPGSGTVIVTLDETAHTLTIEFQFQDLIGTTTAAHLHCCTPPGANAGVATQVPTFIGFPLGVTAGSYLQTFDLTDSASYNPSFVTANGSVAGAEAALIAALFAGEVYANLHTTQFGGGELRANLAEIPVPAALWLFAAGGLVVMRAARRRPTL